MQSSMLRHITEDFGNGGTIDGDLTISGDLTVSGGGSLSFDEIIEGTQVIDVTSTEALLVRKNGDGGDVFVVDSTNSNVLTANGIIHLGDTDTKMHMGDDDIQFIVGNVAMVRMLEDGSQDQVVINEDGADVDFRVEASGNANALLVQGSTGNVGINENSPDEMLHLKSSTNGKPVIKLENSGNNVSSPELNFLNSSTANDNDVTGTIRFKLMNDAGTPEEIEYGTIYGQASDVSDGTEDGKLHFRTMSNGTLDSTLTLSSSEATFRGNINLGDNKALTMGADSDAQLWNDGSNTYIRNNTSDQDIIFQVNDGGSTGTEVMRIDGATSSVGINTSSPSASHALTVVGDVQLTDAHPAINFTDSDDNSDSRIYHSAGSLYLDADNNNEVGSSIMRFSVDDSESMRIDSSGNLLIGHTASVAQEIDGGGHTPNLQINQEGNGGLGITQWNTSNGRTSAPKIWMAKNGGATVGTHASIASGEVLGSIFFSGSDGSTFVNGASIHAIADNSVGSNDMPGALIFSTTPDGDDDVDERMRIASDGKVTFTQDVSGDAYIQVQNKEGGSSSVDETAGIRFSLGDGSALRGGGKITTKKELDFSTSANMDTSMMFSVLENNGWNDALFLTSAGNLGVGVSEPYNLLHIRKSAVTNSDAHDDDLLVIEETGDHCNINMISDTGSYLMWSDATRNVANINYQHSNGVMGFTAETDFQFNKSLKISGANTAHLANALVLGYEGSSKSQIRAYGADASTKGSLEFNMSESDGGESIVMLLDGNSRISLSNNDGNTYNTVLGYDALTNNGTVLGNVGADYNVAIGHDSMGAGNTTDATNNTAVGYLSLRNITSGDNNIAIGSSALAALNTGGSNTVLGKGAGALLTSGNSNVMIGISAGDATVDSSNHVLIGAGAGGNGDIANDGQVAVGYLALHALTSGAGNTAVGYSSLMTATTEIGNTVMGYEAGKSIRHDASDYNVFIGHQASIGGTGARNYSVAIGYRAWGSAGSACNVGGAENVFIGSYSGNGTWVTAASDGNTAVGYDTLSGALNGATLNTGVGKNALKALTQGDHNVAIGADSMIATTTGGANTVVGYQALNGDTDGDGADNTAMGHKALHDAISPSKNVAIGDSAMRVMNGTANGIANCVAIGANAFYGDATNTTTATDGTVAIGYQSLKALTTGVKSVAVGFESQIAQTTGNRNTTVGYRTMYTADGGEDFNTVIGSEAGYYINNDASHDNVIIGKNALQGGTGEIIGCVAIGSNAMDAVSNNNQTGTVAIGTDALGALTTGTGNVAVGHEALKTTGTGAYNTCIGFRAGDVLPDGANSNTAIGFGALGAGNNATTDSNVCIGEGTGGTITDGKQNTIVGTSSNASGASGINQTVLGYAVTGQGDNSVTLGNASVTDVYMASDKGATVHLANINFHGGGVLSGGANTLDDYEEGTWTPVFTGGSSAGSYSMSNTVARYTKIGRVVHVSCSAFNVTQSSAGSGAIEITGLPFTVENTSNSKANVGALELDLFSFTGSLSCTARAGSTIVEFHASATGAVDVTLQVGARDGDDSDFAFNITYTV